MKQSSKEVLESITKVIKGHIEDGNLDRRSLEMLHRTAIRYQNMKDRELRNGTFDYISVEFVTTAYRYILESGGEHTEALEYALFVHGKTKEWLEEAKVKQYIHGKAIVVGHDNHPEQKIMIKNGSMDRGDLMRTKSLVGQLKKLARQKKLSDKMESMAAELKQQEKDLENIKAQQVFFQYMFEELERNKFVPKNSQKKLASSMKSEGISQKDIAEHLEVNIKTIKRWWKGL